VNGNEVSALIAQPQKLGKRESGKSNPFREPVFRVKHNDKPSYQTI
jgi:hypothetical protein